MADNVKTTSFIGNELTLRLIRRKADRHSIGGVWILQQLIINTVKAPKKLFWLFANPTFLSFEENLHLHQHFSTAGTRPGTGT